ncbi:MAG: capsular polysaccharide biosynthesis protein, partial [Pseudomonadota bacterium]
FEAILAGHRPHVFGGAFYAGWGLTEDRVALPRRTGRPSVEQLFDAVIMRYAHWAEPATGEPCTLAHVIEMLAAQARAFRATDGPMRLYAVRPWKRPPVRRFLGAAGAPVRFAGPTGDAREVVWAAREAERPSAVARIEDGFVRSRGLGARLVPPGSLVLDGSGIYFDPHRESDLEHLIAASTDLPRAVLDRAQRLRTQIVAAGVGKYNLPSGKGLPRRSVLVVGQVEDDASIRLGTGPVTTNGDLLKRARTARPDAHLVYRPHPDVAAGLRPGAVDAASRGADLVVEGGDIAPLWPLVDEVWTLTSLAGFEALLRGIQVQCLGAPFYAGWGLTQDHWTEPFAARRTARPSLAGLIHACLIDYPMYLDPLTGTHCSAERAVARIARHETQPRGQVLRVVSAVQTWLRQGR